MCEATRAKNAVYNHKHHDKQLVFIFLMPRGSATGLFTNSVIINVNFVTHFEKVFLFGLYRFQVESQYGITK